MSFYSELKRRSVLRVGAAYAVVAWVIIQIAETILPLFGFDERPVRILVIVLVIGFIPAMIVAWVFELTPEGLKKDEDVDRDVAAAPGAHRSFDRIIMLVLALGLTYFAFDKFVLSKSREQAIIERAREDAVAAALNTMRSNKSIAVLPFVDMSPEKDQEYFADGITEELLNELAQLEGLNVTGRTSSFKFKGHNEDLRIIGEQLGVTNILEGSIRKGGDELRVTAQLIDSQTGTHLWSDTFDRRTDEIFDVQEEIARAVAVALSIKLDIEGRNLLPGAGTNKVEAYDAYLQASDRQIAGSPEVRAALYQQATVLDPNYAEAWMEWGGTLAAGVSWNLPSAEARATQELGRSYVERALEIDPKLYRGYAMLGGFQWARGDWVGATEWGEKYAALVPTDIKAQMGSSNLLSKTGRLNEAIRIVEIEDQIDQITDPFNVFTLLRKAEYYIQARRYEDALETLARADRITGRPSQGAVLRRMFLAVSRAEPVEMRRALEAYAEKDRRVQSVVRAILDNLDSGPTVVLPVMRQIYDEDTELVSEGKMIIAAIAAHFDEPEFALEIMAEELSENMLRINRIWYPFFNEMRALPRFKALVEKAGLVTYWRTYEWADTCRPVSDDDFECS